jgi:predicted ester cyclase
MKSIALAALGTSISIGSANAADALTVEEATALVMPWYQLFNVSEGHDVKAVHEQVYTEDFISCSGYLPADCHDRDASIQMVNGFAQMIPDLRAEVHDVMVSGDKIIVRGQAKGTPAGEFFGVPHTGKSFDIMTIDILTVRDGKISHTYHLENWFGALAQLTAQ